MRNLCLDVGNVLGQLRFDEFVTTISTVKNITEAEAKTRINLYQGLHDVGLISMKQILIKEFGIESEFLRMQIMAKWVEVMSFDQSIIERYEKIVGSHQLALLTNVGHEHVEVLKDNIKFSKSQKFISAVKHQSCEVGVRKPSKIFYQSFLTLHPEFVGAVYVDDSQENLQAAKEFGFKTVHIDLSSMDKKLVEEKLDHVEILLQKALI